MKNIKFLLIGILFGIILTKSEVISWFRIQEMFSFQSFHMYGIIGSAIFTGMISLQIIKRAGLTTFSGEKIAVEPKPFNHGVWIGGLVFGCGWALTGACPGPLFALIGNGASVIVVSLLSAIAGTWVYGVLRNKLPH